MAITQQEYDLLIEDQKKVILLRGAASDLSSLFDDVMERANPEKPLNKNTTYNDLYKVYYQEFNTFKAAVDDAFKNLPADLPPPSP